MGDLPSRAAIDERIEYLFTHTMPELRKQTNVSADAVHVVFDMLRPKLDEANGNLPPIGSPLFTVDGKPIKTKNSKSTKFSSLLLMYNSLDRIDGKEVDQIDDKGGGRIPRWMLPSRGLSAKAWKSAFSKILVNEKLDLDETERLALNKIDYMVYAECVYSVVVDRLCYALAHANSPDNSVGLKLKPSIPYVVYNIPLTKKIVFIKCNTDRLPQDVPDITEAGDVDLRNRTAHGGLVGKPMGPAQYFCKDIAHMADPAYVTSFEKDTGALKSVRLVDLAAEYEKMRAAINTWGIALNLYWDIAFSGWWGVPKSMWRPTGFDFRRDK